MKQSIITFLLLTSIFRGSTQNTWVGTYEGKLDRDQLVLTLKSFGKGSLTGTMTDSANSYDVEGTYTGNTFTGKAHEKNLGLIFDMICIMNENQLHATLTLDVFGNKEKMEISFTRTGAVTKSNVPVKSSNNNPVAGKKRDPSVVGVWVKETNYNSGYGESYGAMSISEKMEFMSDGSLAEGGGQAVISGSNYSGSSTSAQKNIFTGLNWYTEGNKIYLVVTENGQSQTVELGKYYIENNRMLITGSNGEKLLLSKR